MEECKEIEASNGKLQYWYYEKYPNINPDDIKNGSHVQYEWKVSFLLWNRS